MSQYHGDFEPPLSREREAPAAAEPERGGRRRRVARKRGLPTGVLLGLLAIVLIGAGAFAGYMVLEAPHIQQQNKAGGTTATPAAQPVQQQAQVTQNAPASQPNTQTAQQPAQPAQGTQQQAAASSGTAADAQQGPPANVETIDDWVLVCPKEPAGAKCFIQQRLATKDGKTAFLWTIQKDDAGVFHALWQTLPGAQVNRGLTMDIGDGQPRVVPFEGCNAETCVVRAILAPEYLQSLRVAPNVTARITLTANNQPIQFKLSARGLPQALGRL